MKNAFTTGCRVIYLDSLRQPHEALVTAWHGQGPDGQTVEELEQMYKAKGITSPVFLPCCNIVWVSSDSDKRDPYGRQLERATSVSYGRQQGMKPFVGNCWCWPDELEEALRLSLEAL
jgi:hypothetical protein